MSNTRPKLQPLQLLDKILQLFTEAKDPTHELNKDEIYKLLNLDYNVISSDLDEAIAHLESDKLIRKQDAIEDEIGEWYKQKDFILTFSGRLFLLLNGGYIQKLSNEAGEKNQLAYQEKQIRLLTWILALSSLVAAIYYLVELFFPYRHTP